MLRITTIALAFALVPGAACRPTTDGPSTLGQASSESLSPAVRLSADERAAPAIQRCLADSAGVVPRYTDDEPYAAVDPRDARRMLAIWQTRSGAGSVIQWTRSADGGRTWTAPAPVPINACAGGPVASARLSSDPWATFGPDGRAYLSAIAWTPAADDGPDEVSALVVVASADGGITWDAPVACAVAPSRAIAHDNLAITADPTRPGTLYAVTTRAEEPAGGAYFGRLGFTRSRDGGRTWDAIRAISPAVDGERIGAPQIVTDSRTGRLYAVYHRSRQGEGFIGVMISDDAGDSWSGEHQAARHVRGARAMHPVTGRRFVLALDIIQAAVSPVTGELIIAYADARDGEENRTSVSVVRSPDGRRWSRPFDVSESPDKAWLPAIAIRPNGDVAVSYYVADFTSGSPDSRMRVMLRRLPRDSADSIAAATELAVAPLEWPGDYQVLVASGDAFVAVYGVQTDIFARRIE